MLQVAENTKAQEYENHLMKEEMQRQEMLVEKMEQDMERNEDEIRVSTEQPITVEHFLVQPIRFRDCARS